MVSIYANKLADTLRGKAPIVVLLWGDEAGAIRQAATQVKEAVAKQTGLDLADPFAVETFGVSDLLAEPSKLGDAAMTLSFTAPHRLITVANISGTERADEMKAFSKLVEEVLALPLQGVTLLLPVPGHLDKKSALVKTVEGHASGVAVRYFNDSGRDLEGFLKAELTKHGATATQGALSLLAAGLGADREIARREVEKLVIYALGESPITETHVQASLCGATPSGVFLLAEAVLSQQAAKVDLLLHQLNEQGEDLNGAFMMVLGEMKKLTHAKALLQAGEEEGTILAQSGKAMVPPAAKQAFMGAVKRYPPARLALVPEKALEALSLARSGLVPPEYVLARALLSWGV